MGVAASTHATIWVVVLSCLVIGLDSQQNDDSTELTSSTLTTTSSIMQEDEKFRGTTTFMFISTTLVQFMTPGLAILYAGMLDSKSVVAIMAQGLVTMAVVSLLWFAFVFSLVFSDPWLSIGGYGIIGSPFQFSFWQNIAVHGPFQRASSTDAYRFPGYLFAAFQGSIAVLTNAIFTGGPVDRMRLGPLIAFISLWTVFVYAPLAYWNYGGGFMYQLGARDFAGGMVVHEAAGCTSLALLLFLGKRHLREGGSSAYGQPHNVPFVVLGTAILWFGWFGFCGGAAMAIGGLAVIAFINAQLAPSAGMMTWLLLDWAFEGRPTLLGASYGVLCSLAVVSPCAGFVQPYFAVMIGSVAVGFCYMTIKSIEKAGYFDDTCGTVGIHGLGGFIGTCLVGVMADPAECGIIATAPDWCANPGTVTRSWKQLGIQLFCALLAGSFSFIGSSIIVRVIYLFTPRLQSFEEQNWARDSIAHGEVAYILPSRATFDLEGEQGAEDSDGNWQTDAEEPLKKKIYSVVGESPRDSSIVNGVDGL